MGDNSFLDKSTVSSSSRLPFLEKKVKTSHTGLPFLYSDRFENVLSRDGSI